MQTNFENLDDDKFILFKIKTRQKDSIGLEFWNSMANEVCKNEEREKFKLWKDQNKNNKFEFHRKPQMNFRVLKRLTDGLSRRRMERKESERASKKNLEKR